MLLLLINVALASVVDLRDALGVKEWTLEDSCAWPGVYCNANDQITGISLSGLTFHGTLREGMLSNIPHLETLVITGFNSDSDISGVLPSDICENNKLKDIELSYLSISGNIPSTISGCKNLTILRLAKLQLEGTIPDIFNSLPLLGTIELYGNQLTGIIPTTLANLSNLVYIEVYDNLLTGSLPKFKSENLRVIDVRNNKLVGNIPDTLMKLPNLEYVGLDYNDLNVPAICEEIPYCRPINS